METIGIPIEKLQEKKKVTFQHENGSMDLLLNCLEIATLVRHTRDGHKWIIFKKDGTQVSINLDNVLFWKVEED